jgi:hypothetical protein
VVPIACKIEYLSRYFKEFKLATTEKVKGPASYFPSIEKTYGLPMDHWFALISQQQGKKHMEIVNCLKTDHGMGHGHANAVVAYRLATTKP